MDRWLPEILRDLIVPNGSIMETRDGRWAVVQGQAWGNLHLYVHCEPTPEALADFVNTWMAAGRD